MTKNHPRKGVCEYYLMRSDSAADGEGNMERKQIITGPGFYWTRNGAMVQVYIDGNEARGVWLPEARWNLDGTHNHSIYDIVAA